MKSEHRHDLKTNDLAKSLLTFQDYVKVYGGRVVLGLAIVILIIVLLVQRASKARQAEIQMQDDLSYAIGLIDKLSRVQVGMDSQVSVHLAEVEQVRRILQDIREKSSDKKVLADALLAQGDYAWALANYPDLPAATSQPLLRPDKPRPDLLKDAKEAYQQVTDQYPDQQLDVIKAHFGLAAVAENENNWDVAKRQYEAVQAMSGIPTIYTNMAKGRLARLDEIRQPLLVGLVPEKAEEPKRPTFPSTIQDTTKPTTTSTTAPTTKATPVLPTTKATGATTRPAH